MTDILHAGLTMAAIVATAGAANSANDRPLPINMAATPHGSGIRLTVIGAAASPFEAAYALEVTSRSAGGDNHSVQRGKVRLTPGKTVTLITLELGGVPTAKWTATLQVDPVGARSYRQALSSASSTKRQVAG